MSNAAHCRPPALTDEAVSELASTLFPFCSVEAGSPSELASFEDRNYYFRGALEPDPAGSSRVTTAVKAQKHFLLKVAHSSFNREICEAFNDVMRFVFAEGFNCSCPVLTRSGEDVAMVTVKQLTDDVASKRKADHRQFCVRVFTFMPGDKMRAVADLSPAMLFDVGSFIGRMASCLKGFSNAELERREFSSKYINLKFFSDIGRALSTIEDSVHGKMVLDTVHDFNEHVAPKLSGMQSGILHGDAHDGNIILDRDANGLHHVAGIIDFSDCHTSCYLFELAVALAHNMQRMVDPVRDACPFISGFVQAFPLSDDELDCLYISVLARLCLVAVGIEATFAADPSHVYLKEASVPFWKLLGELRTYGKKAVDNIWLTAIN